MRSRYLVKYKGIGGLEFKEVRRLSKRELKRLKTNKDYKIEKINH